MTIYTCANCGAAERHTVAPDSCSSCGGAMETPERHIVDDADPSHIIALWHAGIDLSVAQLKVLSEIMHGNRVDLIVGSYAFVTRNVA